MLTTQNDLEQKYCAANYSPLPVTISRAEGVYVWDVDGKKYMDMLSSYSAISQGHRHPKIIAALIEQCGRVTLTSRAFHNDMLGPFLEKLCLLTGYERALPMNTGAEAVDTAIKAIRKWAVTVKGIPDGKARIIAASNNFHGRTVAAISLSDNNLSRAGFGPLLDGIDMVPFGDPEALEAAITPETAGFIVEPIQGEGGIYVPPDNYLPEVRRICSSRGILFCADEIQTGLGRTGKLLCCDHYGVRPDVVTIGKALGGGVYPVSAMLSDSKIMDVFTPGTHGSTFGGNPLACAVGIAALDVIIDENLAEKAAEQGEYFMSGLRSLKLPIVKEVRGKGLLIGMELTTPTAWDTAIKLLKKGILAKDTRKSIIRFAPPLIITKDQIDEALEIIESALG